VPTYQYACTACGHQMEAVQSFTDEPLTECPECSGRLRKLFSSVGIVFKGSGFYRTDSRSDSTAAANGAATKNGKDGKESTGTSGDSTKTGTDTPKPAASGSTSSPSTPAPATNAAA
jgi:putative FmdB family regulatory protein